MYKISFYKDARGKNSVIENIRLLQAKKDKNARILLSKIKDTIELLKKYGLDLGMPYIRRIRNNLWEMRPQRNRILFFYYKDSEFVILHDFIKKTNKTPRNEILIAEHYRNNWLRRYENEKEKN